MPTILMDGTIPAGLSYFDQYQVYNCLDAAITAQLLPVMKAELGNIGHETYARRMRTQALCLEMSRKGFPVDHMPMLNLVKQLEADERKADHILLQFTKAVGYAGVLNPRSPQQVAGFFYDYLGIPPVYKYDHKTKQRRRDTSRDALEKLSAQRPIALPFVNAILASRDARKLAGVFKRGLEPGNPPLLRCNFSPSGTETGRLSSQQNVYGRGTNGQNLSPRVRRVIAAPPGYAIVYPDLKTAESFAVGYLSGDRAYIDACHSADLHTSAARMVWPTAVDWTGDTRKDKELASSPAYRYFSYRDLSKRIGHATNYYGKPPTISKQHGVPVKLIEAFQSGYFEAFPGIRAWQLKVIQDVQQSGTLINPFGAERRFWGRPNDEATWREAIAHLPQSIVAEIENIGLCNVQEWIVKNKLWKQIDLRAQIHDAGFFIVPISELSWVVPELCRRLVVPVDFGEQGVMKVPVDAKVGKNWDERKWNKDKKCWDNPEGLYDWKPGQELHFKV